LGQCRAGSTTSEEDIDVDGISYGFMASQALFAALELELFDHIAAKGAPASIEDMQKATGITAPRLQVLVNALTSMKALKKGPNGYETSPNTSRFLVRSAKHFYGDYLRLQMGQQFYKHMGALPQIMKTGKGPTYEQLFSDPAEADTYTKAQHNGSLATAKGLCKRVDLKGIKSMLDIGGGSGAFSIMICRQNPQLKATVLEFPEVCNTGEKFVAAEPAEVASRVKYVRGSCLDAWPADLGSGHDMVLISYVSESVPHGAVPMLYERAFERLRPGGMLIVHSFMVDDSLEGPLLGALWSLQHIAVNADGLGLHPANVSAFMTKAGFGDITTAEMIGGLTKVIIGKKPA
jgi:predicted O-methyltransferase YrrM